MRIASFSSAARRRTAIAAACLGAATIAVPGVAWAQNPIGSSSPTVVGSFAPAAAPDRIDGCQYLERAIPSGEAHIMQPDGIIQNFDFENGEIRYAEPGNGPGEMQLMYPDGTVQKYNVEDGVAVEITETGPGAGLPGGDWNLIEVTPDQAIRAVNPC
ncbi:hypothetical protein BFN03_00980 [Rhodococcus sp. WMMA185]|uniref:hypothetical protein n=1 Tax=Rhodococcus sp. WMMA185 TaxID=679318 RepID=UPI000877EE76|nr:hypothetical protein [Rhodococcus sp. WMMA185]AOW91741.1 hypothetical protein BFN03_00980 [Rhodococcus sp. WMMA185]